MTGSESSIWVVGEVFEFSGEKIKGLNRKSSNSKGQKMGFFNGQ
jgi:hypothetical protein